MSFYNALGRAVFNRIPSYSQALYRVCHAYVDRFNGDNNSDPKTNGEEMLLHSELPNLRGKIVFDVGANIGKWAKSALEIESSIYLHCFEPSHQTFIQLSKNKWPDNVCLNNFGLGEMSAELDLNIVDQSSGLNSLYLRRGIDSAQVKAKETVSIVTGDSYCQKFGIDRIHFLKVDVEGHELAVFKGMSRMLQEGRIQMIQFEYGGCNLDARVYLADIWDYLAPFGFSFYKLYPHGPKAVPNYSQSLETFKYANYLARVYK